MTDQYTELAMPEFRQKSRTGFWQSTEAEYREMYWTLLAAASDGPVTSREEAYSRPDQKSVFGRLAWQETTTETIYPNFFRDSGLRVYTRVLENPLSAALTSVWKPVLLLLGLALLAALYIYMLTDRFITRPLVLAAGKACLLEDPDTRFWQEDLSRPDELGDLNRALKQAETAFQCRWSTERTLARKRQEFAAAASHDLKTPLALIRGYTEAIQQDISPAENERYLDAIEREAEKMNRLIVEMLDYTRLDRMEQLERKREENLPVLLGSWLNEAAPLFEGRSLTWSLPQKLLVRCDQALFRRAVDNLLSNAAKFTPPGGAVQVTLTAQEEPDIPGGTGFTLAVENDGESIPESDLERIFEMFYCTDRARTRGSGGNGVGLAAAARICALHGFTLRVENTQSGIKFMIEGASSK